MLGSDAQETTEAVSTISANANSASLHMDKPDSTDSRGSTDTNTGDRRALPADRHMQGIHACRMGFHCLKFNIRRVVETGIYEHQNYSWHPRFF
jgi:hypothetical protein